jgi:hypothetical protein
MPHRIGGRGEKPAGLPEPTTSSMLEPFREDPCENCFGEQVRFDR